MRAGFGAALELLARGLVGLGRRAMRMGAALEARAHRADASSAHEERQPVVPASSRIPRAWAEIVAASAPEYLEELLRAEAEETGFGAAPERSVEPETVDPDLVLRANEGLEISVDARAPHTRDASSGSSQPGTTEPDGGATPPLRARGSSWRAASAETSAHATVPRDADIQGTTRPRDRARLEWREPGHRSGEAPRGSLPIGGDRAPSSGGGLDPARRTIRPRFRAIREPETAADRAGDSRGTQGWTGSADEGARSSSRPHGARGAHGRVEPPGVTEARALHDRAPWSSANGRSTSGSDPVTRPAPPTRAVGRDAARADVPIDLGDETANASSARVARSSPHHASGGIETNVRPGLTGERRAPGTPPSLARNADARVGVRGRALDGLAPGWSLATSRTADVLDRRADARPSRVDGNVERIDPWPALPPLRLAQAMSSEPASDEAARGGRVDREQFGESVTVPR